MQAIAISLKRLVWAKLRYYLVDNVQELEEHGGKVCVLSVLSGQVGPVLKLVAQRQPLFLHQHSEAFQRPVVRVHAKLGNITCGHSRNKLTKK